MSSASLPYPGQEAERVKASDTAAGTFTLKKRPSLMCDRLSRAWPHRVQSSGSVGPGRFSHGPHVWQGQGHCHLGHPLQANAAKLVEDEAR